MSILVKCSIHPKYSGNIAPKYKVHCDKCWSIYFLKSGQRAPHKPTKMHVDKSKYSRKDKHKKAIK